jgi:hypothetical protein
MDADHQGLPSLAVVAARSAAAWHPAWQVQAFSCGCQAVLSKTWLSFRAARLHTADCYGKDRHISPAVWEGVAMLPDQHQHLPHLACTLLRNGCLLLGIICCK